MIGEGDSGRDSAQSMRHGHRHARKVSLFLGDPLAGSLALGALNLSKNRLPRLTRRRGELTHERAAKDGGMGRGILHAELDRPAKRVGVVHVETARDAQRVACGREGVIHQVRVDGERPRRGEGLAELPDTQVVS